MGIGYPLFWLLLMICTLCQYISVKDFTFTFHFHALEKEMATHSSVLAWRIPGTGEPGRLPSMGSHRVNKPFKLVFVSASPYLAEGASGGQGLSALLPAFHSAQGRFSVNCGWEMLRWTSSQGWARIQWDETYEIECQIARCFLDVR